MKQIVQHFFIFLRSEAGWTINFILAHLLFWCYGGFETVRTIFFLSDSIVVIEILEMEIMVHAIGS